MKKKKIAVLHAQIPFVRGGAELLVENLTRQLINRGYDTEIIPMPFRWYPNNVLIDSYMLWRMADITESNGEKVDLAIALKAPTYMVRHPNKVLWLMHQHRPVYDLADNSSANGANTIPGGRELREKIIGMDNLALSELKKIYTISRNVTGRLKKYNGFDSTPLYHPPALAGRYFSEDYGDYILSVGRLDDNKRVRLLIESLVHCDRKIKAIIGGKGPGLEPLQKLAEKLGVADRVRFLGFVPDEDLLELYANALGVFFAPIDEDYGYITLEAFLSKRPVFTCHDSGGVLEFAEDGKSACVVDYDPAAMGAAFNRLYKNKKLARDFGHAGFNVVKDIKWDRVIDELTKTIR